MDTDEELSELRALLLKTLEENEGLRKLLAQLQLELNGKSDRIESSSH